MNATTTYNVNDEVLIRSMNKRAWIEEMIGSDMARVGFYHGPYKCGGYLLIQELDPIVEPDSLDAIDFGCGCGGF